MCRPMRGAVMTWCFCMVLTTTHNSLSDRLLINHEQVKACLQTVIGRYFHHSRAFIYFERNSDYAPLVAQLVMEKGTMHVWTVTGEREMVPPEHQVKNPDMGCLLLVLTTVPHNLTQQLLVIRSLSVLGASSRVLVIVPSLDLQVIEDVLSQVWLRLRALHVTIMAIGTSEIKFYTSQHYGLPKLHMQFVDQWETAFNTNANLFPRKIPKDFMGDTLRAAVGVQPPFAFLTGDQNEPFDGTEVRVIKTLAQHLNMTVEYLPEGDFARATIFHNKYVGLYGQLWTHQADLICCGLTNFPERMAVSSVLPANKIENMIWCAPGPRKIVNWTILYGAFSSAVWLSIIVTLAILVVVLYGKFLTHHSNSSTFLDAFFDILAICLENSIPNAQDFNCFPLFFAMVLLFSLVISAVYKSGLMTKLTAPISEKPIDTIQQALDNGLHFRFIPAVPSHLKNILDPMSLEILRPNNYQTSANMTYNLEQVAIARTAMVLCYQSTCMFINSNQFLDHSGSSQVHYQSERIVSSPIHIFIGTGNGLEPVLRLKSLQLNEAGIVDLWMRDILYNTKVKAMTLVRERAVSHSQQVALTFQQLSVVFYLTLLSLSVSFLFYLIEMTLGCLSDRRIKLKR